MRPMGGRQITSVKMVEFGWVLTVAPDGSQAAMWVKVAGSSVRPAMVSSVM